MMSFKDNKPGDTVKAFSPNISGFTKFEWIKKPTHTPQLRSVTLYGIEVEDADGTAGPKGFVVRAAGRLRMGTRVILENGADLSLAELIAANGGRRTEAGLIASAAGEGPFVWPFGPNLPQPEDYVLARSAVTLAEIYAAAEWETAPALPGPARGDLGPVGAAPAARRDKMPANLPLSMRAPNRTGLQ